MRHWIPIFEIDEGDVDTIQLDKTNNFDLPEGMLEDFSQILRGRVESDDS